MPDQLTIRNKSSKKINTRFLKKIIYYGLINILKEKDFDLAIFLVNPKTIEKINKQFLNHDGVTDVISFDYSDYPEINTLSNQRKTDSYLYGEIYICPHVAEEQSRQFNTTTEEEIVRYAIHGILHLKGYDDLTSIELKKMRKMENKVISQLKKEFIFKHLIKY
ncbi:MAG: rRNA maturation RNase YbeY [Verrucomicrobiia bacterium]